MADSHRAARRPRRRLVLGECCQDVGDIGLGGEQDGPGDIDALEASTAEVSLPSLVSAQQLQLSGTHGAVMAGAQQEITWWAGGARPQRKFAAIYIELRIDLLTLFPPRGEPR